MEKIKTEFRTITLQYLLLLEKLIIITLYFLQKLKLHF